ncbi:c-type cytochrome biogenesis protein CcmI [Fodinicurvata halophila]|uniref:c-type cytochrome biogenesis protein CcmI n=1 Tax=Fodinicurvata halophila TaxID=1419723 RepID=UPI00362966FA
MSWLFWILAATLTALAGLFLVRPLVRSSTQESPTGGGEDVEVYRAQLREVERDLERGVLAPAEAKAARLEIERRLLAADSRAGSRTEAGALSSHLSRLTALALLVILPLGSVSLYLWLGQPGLPGQPLAQRGEEVQQQRDIAEMVEGLRARLEENPEDLRGWEMLGRSYGVLGRWDEAAKAYREALSRSEGPRPGLQSALGEALVTINQGRVSPEAERAFDAALEANPQDARARFYKALALEQGVTRAPRWIAGSPWRRTRRKAPDGGRCSCSRSPPQHRSWGSIPTSWRETATTRPPPLDSPMSGTWTRRNRKPISARWSMAWPHACRTILGTPKGGCAWPRHAWCLRNGRPRRRPWNAPASRSTACPRMRRSVRNWSVPWSRWRSASSPIARFQLGIPRM